MWHHRLITLLACRDAVSPEVAPSLPLQAMANPEHDNYGRIASAMEQVVLDFQGLSCRHGRVLTGIGVGGAPRPGSGQPTR